MHALADQGVIDVPTLGQSSSHPGSSLPLCIGQIGPEFRLDLID
jgi:hypothetical protein